MDFTREPVVESVVTPKEGCKLVVRSSKTAGAEEYFVDAVEIVRFGEAVFFRSMERPKSFLVPVSDYEVVEVRETRMILKTPSSEKGAIKIAGGRVGDRGESEKEMKKTSESRLEKKRRPRRRRKGREEREEGTPEEESYEGTEEPYEEEAPATTETGKTVISPSLTSLLPPPKTLIRETISRYKEDDLFKEAFYSRNEEAAPSEEEPEKSDTETESESFIEEPSPENEDEWPPQPLYDEVIEQPDSPKERAGKETPSEAEHEDVNTL